MEDAEGICSDEDPDKLDIFELHQQLMNKSLITSEEIYFDGAGKDRRTRYKFLETIKQYAQEKLMEMGEMEKLRNNHLNYYLKLANEGHEATKIGSASSTYWLNYCDIETDNLRSAFEFALGDDRLVEAATLLTGWAWYLRKGSIDELNTKGRLLYSDEKYSTLPGELKVNLIRLLYAFAIRQEERKQMMTELEGLLNADLPAWARISAGIILGEYTAIFRENIDQAVAFFEQATALAIQNNYFYGYSWSVNARCRHLIRTGREKEVQQLLPELIRLIETKNISSESSITYHLLADLAIILNNLVEAEFYARKAIEFLENGQLRFRPTIRAYPTLAEILIRKGQYEEAYRLLTQIISQATLYPNEVQLFTSKTYFAVLQMLRGEYQAALEVIATLSEYYERYYISGEEKRYLPAFQPTLIFSLAFAIGEYSEGVVIFSAVEYKVKSLGWLFGKFLEKARIALSKEEYQVAYQKGKELDERSAWEPAKKLRAKLESVITQKALVAAKPNSNRGGLSERELEILGLVAQGLTDGQIADKLVISRRTVSKHLQLIYQKIGASSRTAATRYALDNKLV